MASTFDPPVFVNCRDRVRDLRALVAWLEKAGHERLVLIDNASTFEPLLDYLAGTPHEVVRLGRNCGSRAIWEANLVPADGWYVYTDPDVVPMDDCPLDAVLYLHDLLGRHPDFPKAALGLHLDDLPATTDPGIAAWERALVAPGRSVERGVFASLVDTTFALYRPGAPFGYMALRTSAPYQCRHMPWYVAEPDAEDRYYLDRAIAGPMGSSWAQACQ